MSHAGHLYRIMGHYGGRSGGISMLKNALCFVYHYMQYYLTDPQGFSPVEAGQQRLHRLTTLPTSLLVTGSRLLLKSFLLPGVVLHVLPHTKSYLSPGSSLIFCTFPVPPPALLSLQVTLRILCRPILTMSLSACVTRILSLSGFPPELKTRDIQAAFAEFENERGGFKIKWIDDTSLLVVFNDPVVGTSLVSPAIACRRYTVGLSR